jgi:hypothetical protein
VFHSLVFAAQTLPIRHWTEDSGTEKAIPFRLESAIVDSLGLCDFAAGPRTDFLWRSQSDSDCFKILQKLAFVDLISKHSQG